MAPGAVVGVHVNEGIEVGEAVSVGEVVSVCVGNSVLLDVAEGTGVAANKDALGEGDGGIPPLAVAHPAAKTAPAANNATQNTHILPLIW